MLTSNHKGLQRAWDMLVRAYGSKDGWQYIGSSHEHQFQNKGQCLNPKVVEDGVTFSSYTQDQLLAGPMSFYYVPSQPGDWDEIDGSNSKPVDNYTCKCGNSRLCTFTDKSCWSCGEPVKS